MNAIPSATVSEIRPPADSPRTRRRKSVPLSRLTISPLNERKIRPGVEADDELLASVRENGLYFPLLVVEGTETDEVVDGGRRLAALGLLVDDNAISEDELVQCEIIDAADARLVSTDANRTHMPVHPVDRYRAFAALVEEGRDEGEISTLFGTPVSEVRKHLALGRVHPEILDAYAAGTVDEALLKTFTMTDDRERQIAAWHSARSTASWNHGHRVRSILTEGMRSSGSAAGRAISAEEYTAAGGTVTEDLFGDETFFDDPKLLERLVDAKVAGVIAKLEIGWKWIEQRNERFHPLQYDCEQRNPKKAAFPADVLDNLSDLEDAARAAQEDDRAYRSAIQQLAIARIDAELEHWTYSKSVRARCGVVVSLGLLGEIVVHRGLLKAADKRAEEKAKKRAAATKEAAAAGKPLPPPEARPNNKLALELGVIRREATRVELASASDVAIEALHYHTVCEALRLNRGGGDRLLRVQRVSGDSCYEERAPSHAERALAVVDMPAAKRRAEILAGLELGWTNKHPGYARYRAWQELTAIQQDDLVAYAVGEMLGDGYRAPGLEYDVDAIVEDLAVDVGRYWQPDAAYFGRLTSADLRDLLVAWYGEEHAKVVATQKKTALVDACARIWTVPEVQLTDAETMIRNSWLPSALTTPINATPARLLKRRSA